MYIHMNADSRICYLLNAVNVYKKMMNKCEEERKTLVEVT